MDEANWELGQKCFETCAENFDGTFIMILDHLESGESDFYVDIDVCDEETFYIIKGLLLMTVEKMEFENG